MPRYRMQTLGMDGNIWYSILDTWNFEDFIGMHKNKDIAQDYIERMNTEWEGVDESSDL